MKVHIPNSAFLGNIDPFIRSIDFSEPERFQVTGNKKWISIHPVILTIIASMGLDVDPGNIDISMEARSGHYLERMGLYRLLGQEFNFRIIEHEPSGRFIPLSVIRESDDLSRFITDVIPLLHLEPEMALPIKYTLSELVRNVLEHSESRRGAIVAAQYYKKSNTIRLGITDNGVGIRKSISRSHLAESDLDAIRLALMPGITGTTRREGGTEQNAGAGLFFIKSIATVNRDFFMVYSGNAMYKLLRSSRIRTKRRLKADPLKDRHSCDENFPYWKGTVVGIDISLSETEGFSNILDEINKTYIQTIKERKKARYRRPRFQ